MRTSKRTAMLIAATMFLFIPLSLTYAREIYVDPNGSRDFTTIQQAIDAASDGDEVIVCPNTYTGPENRDLDLTRGKPEGQTRAITIHGLNPVDPDVVAATIIDCNGTEAEYHRAFYFHAQDVNCFVVGLTIINGYAAQGGAIYAEPNSSPIIGNCIIKKCRAQLQGGAAYGSDGDFIFCTINDNWAAVAGGALAMCNGLIDLCELSANLTDGDGAALYGCNGLTDRCNILGNFGDAVVACAGEIIHCTISDNSGTGIVNCPGTIGDCTISNNAGGLYGCHGLIGDCDILSNSADRGAGLYDCDGTINRCTISDNTADFGGGLYGCDGDINDCNILNNYAQYEGGGLMVCNGNITRCTIKGNQTPLHGAGLAHCGGLVADSLIWLNGAADSGGGLYDCNALISNSTITGNSAKYAGGGLYGCSATIRNSLINYNTSEVGSGGGLNGCDGLIINCTIADNMAIGQNGGGLNWCKGQIVNCVIWNNWAGKSGWQLFASSQPTFSCVQGGSLGAGNISDDPLFFDSANGDYHLMSEAGRWDPAIASWVVDDFTSPCIDAGHPTVDWTAELWPHGRRINMGAYGGTPQASMSTSYELGFLADLDGDFKVTFADYALLARHWLEEVSLAAEDLDGDGIVDIYDLEIFAYDWALSDDTPAEGIGDDFESGNFSRQPWEHSGHAFWQISSVAWEGDFSAEAGNIGNNEQTILQVVLTAEYAANHLRFARMVSSELGCDFLRFYIDGQLKAEWSGEADWQVITFPLTQGPHTLKWEYSKDYAGSSGSDTAWIDDVKIFFDPRKN